MVKKKKKNSGEMEKERKLEEPCCAMEIEEQLEVPCCAMEIEEQLEVPRWATKKKKQLYQPTFPHRRKSTSTRTFTSIAFVLLTCLLLMMHKSLQHLKGQQLGEGAFGKVYLGKLNGEVVAIKEITLQNDNITERAMKEIKIFAKLHHPNIVGYKGCQKKTSNGNNKICIYMELCEGGDLHETIQACKAQNLLLTEGQILDYLYGIISGIQYLHSNNIVHRDLKPQNILLHRGCIKLCDFGFAKDLESIQDCHASVLGTPMYACPEIYSGYCDKKGDMWSLGCILYELLTLKPLFAPPCDVKKFCNTELELPGISSLYSNYWKSLISNLLRPDPNERPTSTALLEGLNLMYPAISFARTF